MIRRIAREIALQSLFQIDFNDCDPETAVTASIEEHKGKNVLLAKEYAINLVKGVLANLDLIDASLEQYAIDWKIMRMPATDRNILRVAVYEMLYAPEHLSPGIAINEAVEIAKIYGTDESPRFINGILGRLIKK